MEGDSDSDDMFTETIPELAKSVPEKSKEIYESTYKYFIAWTEENNVKAISENVLLAYFSELSKKFKSPTLWSKFSMLKNQLDIKKNINIMTYRRLISFIKQNNIGYKPKKSKVLTKDEFNNFIDNAPDNSYLAIKVILIFGVSGACRCDELKNLTIHNIQEVGNLLLVTLPDSKTKLPRSFTIVGEKYVNIYKKYAVLRPQGMEEISDRFFIRYNNGKCVRSVMGIHAISSVPQKVAHYLKLLNEKEYTGHCLRRTSATFQVDKGGHVTALKHHSGWKSPSVEEGYRDESLNDRNDTDSKILDLPSTSSSPHDSIMHTETKIEDINENPFIKIEDYNEDQQISINEVNDVENNQNTYNKPPNYTYDIVKEIADWLLNRTSFRPKVGIICGSGMGSIADMLTDTSTFKYEEIPYFPTSTVPGHAGRLLFGYLEGIQVMCMQGRFHYYEGYPLWKCSMPIRVMKLCGVTHLIVSNAAGGLNENFKEGDIMIIKDHINMMGFAGNNPLQGFNDERFGPRFIAVNRAYNKELIIAARSLAKEINIEGIVKEGVYAVLGGPNFETVAELRMLRQCGVDAVGMSTVAEVLTAHHAGLVVFAFSLITNLCVMDYDDTQEPNHSEVMAVSKRMEPTLKQWVHKLVTHINTTTLN